MFAGIGLLLATPLMLALDAAFSSMTDVKQVAEAPWRGSTVRVYKITPGALSSDFIRVRQERIVFPGLVLVRHIDSFDIDSNLDTRIDVAATRDGVELRLNSLPHPYQLKRFVYF